MPSCRLVSHGFTGLTLGADKPVDETVKKMATMQFPAFALGTSPYDSQNRHRVVDIDVPVEIGGVPFRPGELVIADVDGIVVVPREVEEAAIRAAWNKVHAENVTRDAIKAGMKAAHAYEKYGVL